MNTYNFDNKTSSPKKGLMLFVTLVIILIITYLYNDTVNLEINKIEKDIGIQIKKLKDNTDPIVEKEKVSDEKTKTILEDEIEKTKSEKTLSIPKKKQMFLNLLLEPINKVYKEFDILYKEIKNNKNDKRIASLKKTYKVKTYKELLLALKPHPKSIALAQAAMESAWASSRFFKEANNIFGVWSFNKNEPRIAAGEQRGKQTIWLKKYASIEDSVRDYYKTLSRSKAFKAFRILNAKKEYQDPYLLTVKLDKYSEKGSLYGEELNSMISYNNFTRYDEKNILKKKSNK